MMRRIPAAVRLASLSLATSLSLPVLADIDLVGDPTLFNIGDVTLTDSASLTNLIVTQYNLTAPWMQLSGNGSISQYGTVQTNVIEVNGGAIQLATEGRLNSQDIYINANYPSGNASLEAEDYGTQINSNNLHLNSQDGYQASLNLSNGATATINNQLTLWGNDSVVNLDNASLTTYNLHNEGTINVSGMASSVQILAMNNGYFWQQLGNINFSQGAQFNQFQLSLSNGDLVTATDAGTQINATMTHIEDTILQINDGAKINSSDIWLYAGGSAGQNASLNADGSGVPNNDPYDPPVSSQIKTDYLYITSAGDYQASLNLSNDAAANINYDLRIIGADSVVNLDNASLTTYNLRNEGTINVSGNNSSLQITNNGYSGEPLGKINFLNGAQFNQDYLTLRNGDLISASGTDTTINANYAIIDRTTLDIDNGAELNASFINIIAGGEQPYLPAGDSTINADGANTQINSNDLYLNSWDSYQAKLNLSNGAAVTITGNTGIHGSDSVVNLDNASLTTNYLHNEGTINVSGSNSSLQITNNGYPSEPLGKINFSNDAQFNQYQLNLRQGDLITATDVGTQINTSITTIDGTTLQLNNGAALVANDIWLMASEWNGGNATLNTDGAGILNNDPYLMPAPTQINTNSLNINSWDGYLASLNLSNGAAANINSELRINGENSVVNLDNASLTTYYLHNEGTINVSGSNSSLQITNNGYSSEPLGKINFSGGAQFNQDYLFLHNGDLVTATDSDTQINASMTSIEGTTLALNNGATLNSNDIYLIAYQGNNSNAALNADGAGIPNNDPYLPQVPTQINTNYLSLYSEDGYQASLNLSNGATANISSELRLNGADSVVNLDNASLTTNTLHNEGTINIAGAASSLQINNNYYYGNPIGKINFSNGAQLNHQDYLRLRNGDLISATDIGTQINTLGTDIQGTSLQLNNGAELNSNEVWLMADFWNGGDASINADGTQVPTTDPYAPPVPTQINSYNLTLDSFNGYRASVNLSNGATANINNELRLNGTDSVVNLDNASLTTYRMYNEGTINVSGAESLLWIHSPYSSYGKINLSNGAQLNHSDLDLHDGDLITATSAGTQINSFSTVIQDADLVLNDGAKLNSYSHIFVDAKSTINSDNASIEAGSLYNLGRLISQGNDQITGHVDNNGIIDIEDRLTITGDLHMQSEGSLLFNFGDDPLNEFGTLVLNGYLWGDDAIDIRFDATEYMEADHAYGYTIDLIVATGFLPDIGMFNIDMSAFNFLGEKWNRSVSVIDNRLVLSVTSEVPVPASLWLMVSALGGLVAIRRNRTRLIH